MRVDYLKLNADKTKFLIIGTQRQHSLKIERYAFLLLSQYVMPAVSTWNLAIIFDDNFNFKEHISKIY